MKNILFFLIIITCVFSLQAQSQITIATGESPPFTGENLKHDGFINQVISEVFALYNINVEFVYLPWRRAYKSTQEGKYDASSYWFLNEERELDFLMSEAINNDRLVFVQTNTSDIIKWESLEDFRGHTIGYTDGNTYPYSLVYAIENGVIQGEMAPDDTTNLKKLMLNRIELFVVSQSTVYVLAQQLTNESFDKNFTVSGQTLEETSGHLAISRNGNNNPQQLLQIFNQGLKQLRDNGRYQQLVDQLRNNYY